MIKKGHSSSSEENTEIVWEKELGKHPKGCRQRMRLKWVDELWQREDMFFPLRYQKEREGDCKYPVRFYRYSGR